MFLYLPFQAVHYPLQAPEKYIEPFKKLTKDKDRQTMGGMLGCLDEAVGNITQTLKDTGLYDNTIIIFSTGKTCFVPGKGTHKCQHDGYVQRSRLPFHNQSAVHH